MSYAKHLAEHARIAILRALADSAGYSSNSSVLGDLLPAFGLTLSRDQLESQLSWLHEQGLIETTAIGSVITARLTARGHDVAKGIATVPGVRRPGP